MVVEARRFLVVDIIMGPPRHEMVQCEVNIYYVDIFSLDITGSGSVSFLAPSGAV